MSSLRPLPDVRVFGRPERPHRCDLGFDVERHIRDLVASVARIESQVPRVAFFEYFSHDIAGVACGDEPEVTDDGLCDDFLGGYGFGRYRGAHFDGMVTSLGWLT